MSLLEQSQSASPALLGRIAGLRARARQLMIIQGVSLVAAAIFGGELLLAIVDYALNLNPPLRLLLLVISVLALIFWIRKVLVRPLSVPLSNAFLAAQIEKTHPELADEIISAVDFSSRENVSHNALAHQVLTDAESRATQLPIRDVLNHRIWHKPCGLAVALLGIILLLCVLFPQHAGVALARWVKPFADIPWPRHTFVNLEWPGQTPPKVWPIGEPLTVRAHITRGQQAGMRVWLEHATDQQPVTRELMTEQNAADSGVYERIIEPQGQKLRLRVMAGDDNDQQMSSIRLSPRPTVTRLLAHITPPVYAGNQASTVDLLTQAPRVIKGSKVTLEIRSSKALANGKQSPIAWLMHAEEPTILPLEYSVNSQDSATATLSLIARRTGTRNEPLRFRVQVRDEDGFENRVIPVAALDIIPDAQPSVFLVEPRRSLEVVPDALIDVLISATDDLGLTDVELLANDFNAGAGQPPRITVPLAWSTQQRDAGTGLFTSKAQYAWDLAPLQLKAGERLMIHATVRDNYSVPATDHTPASLPDPFVRIGNVIRHQYVSSAALSLTIVTREKAEETIRRAMQEVRDQLRNLHDQQELTAQQTAALRDVIARTGVITPAQAQQLGDLAARQAAHALRATAIEQNAAQINQNINMNRMQNTELAGIGKILQQGLNQIASQSMPRAAQDLHHARESAEKPKTSQQAVTSASQQQAKAVEDLQKLIDQLGAAGDFEALRAKTAEILRQQKELEQQLRELAAKTVGKEIAQLSPDEIKAAEKLAADQQKLAALSADLTAKMEKAAQQIQQQDPGSAASLRDAANSGKQSNVSGNQASAAAAVNKNQTSGAAADMARARKGLEEMMRQLDQQSRRQLEELSRKLGELLDQVQQLRDKQSALNDKTNQAGESAAKKALATLGDQQGRLQGNALAIAKIADATKGAKPAAEDIRAAAESMTSSAVALVKGIFADASAPQKEAIAALDRAIDKLRKQKDELDQQLQQQDLEAIRKRYEAIKIEQESVRAETTNIEKRRLANHDLARADLIKLAEQGTTQGKLTGRITELSNLDDLKNIEVLNLLNRQLIAAMQSSQKSLLAGKSSKEVTFRQDYAIRKLAAIIEALKQEQAKPSQFAGSSGGGQGGQGGKKPLVPPIAQLKMLKSLQNEINEQTQSLNDQLKSAPATEKTEIRNQINDLGAQQDTVRSMAQKVMEKLK